MASADVLVISAEQDLTDRVASIVRSVPGCVFSHWTTVPPQGITDMSLRSLALVIVHQAGPVTRDCVQRVLEIAAVADQPKTSVIVILDELSAVDIERWMTSGAAECLCRPLDLGRLALLLDSSTLHARESRRPLPRDHWLLVDGQPPFCCMSDGMHSLAARVEKVANRDSNVLITGETGTGKTHLAGVMHGLSKRAEHPFLAVNCAAIPAELVESELFGHRRGAFTGAHQDHPGKLKTAGSGTLLLDEIDSLPLGTQAKLLHVVEGRSYVPIGGMQAMSFQGRLMAASNQSLEALVEQRRFRADLYFRLNVVELEIPPLRTRLCELPLLVESYLAESARHYDRPAQCFAPEALEMLLRHSWPGNVRELYNVLERALAYCDEPEIGLRELCDSWGRRSATCAGQEVASRIHLESPRAAGLANPPRLREIVGSAEPWHLPGESSERTRLVELLRRHAQNRSCVARELGISRTALYKKLDKLGLMRRLVSDSA